MKRNYTISFTLIILFALISTIQVQAQKRYFTRSGNVKFFSSTPVEDIEAKNHKVTAVVDANTNKMEFAALIKAFEFEKALMEEHFNENYMESSKFPKATFKGSILTPKGIDLKKPGEYKVTVKGAMTIHGVTKEIQVPGTVKITDGKMNINADFHIKPEDYDIKIPGAVKNNIAKEIKVTVDMGLAPMG